MQGLVNDRWWAITAKAVAAGALLGALHGAFTPAQPTSNHHRSTANVSVAPLKSYGSRLAPITMTLFTDYQCPSCRVLYEDSLRPMIGGYIASGKVCLLHYDFPLPQHA